MFKNVSFVIKSGNFARMNSTEYSEEFHLIHNLGHVTRWQAANETIRAESVT